MDTLAKLAIQGGSFLISAVVLAYLAKWFVIPALKEAWQQHVAGVSGLSDSIKESTKAQQDTREEVIRMSARLDAFVSIDERDSRREVDRTKTDEDLPPVRLRAATNKET